MCGIFGWTFGPNSPLSPGQREAFAASLALANGRRGPHSWGAYMATRKGEERGGTAWEIEEIRRVGNIANERGLGALGMCDVMMGHTRWATNGAVTEANCHPFTVGEVTLAHNGMIYNHAEIAARYGRTCEVDSQHIAHHLHERRDFGEFQGYGAIMYVRAPAPGDVHLCRMRNGNLAIYGLGERGKPWGIAWSSDERHLRDALHAARIKSFPYEQPKEGRVYVAGADGVLYLLPPTLTHTLGADSLSPEERRRNAALTAGEGEKKTALHPSAVAAAKKRAKRERDLSTPSDLKRPKSAKGKRRAERRAARKTGAATGEDRPGWIRIGTKSLPDDSADAAYIKIAAGVVIRALDAHGAAGGERAMVVEAAKAVNGLRAHGLSHVSRDDVERAIEREVFAQMRAGPRKGSANLDLFAEPNTEREAEVQMDADAQAFLSQTLGAKSPTMIH